MEQLSLFDFQSLNEDLLELNQLVTVRKPSKEDDIETYYYLKNFVGQIGKIIKVGTKYNPVAFFVDFNGKTAILNKQDLIVL